MATSADVVDELSTDELRAALAAVRAHPGFALLAEIERQIIDDLLGAQALRLRCAGCRKMVEALQERVRTLAERHQDQESPH